MQLKNTVRYHIIQTRMMIHQNVKKKKCWWRMWGRWCLMHYYWEQPLWKAVRWFLRSLNTDLAYDPAMPSPGRITHRNRIHMNHLYSHVNSNSRWKPLRNHPAKGLDKEVMVNIQRCITRLWKSKCWYWQENGYNRSLC